MFNTVRKDKNRRILVKKFEVQRLQSKAIFEDILLKSEINAFFREKFAHKKKHQSKNVNDIEVSSFWRRKVIKTFPRNSSKVGIQNRCIESGRARAVVRLFKLSRICLRDKASKGEIPGLKKASW